MAERPPIPPPPYHGGCLCGAVRYELTAKPVAVLACHCSDCKKMSGATNLLMVWLPREGFRQVCGAVDRFRRRADSGRESDIVRCTKCGTRLWHESLTAGHLAFVAAGTLDDSSWAVPACHIWVEKASAGAVIQADAVLIQGQPIERRLVMEAFSAIYGHDG